MSFPLFSIIIPLYNKASYIKDALWSVKHQTLEDYEVIVVDDGSTDGGSDIVKSFDLIPTQLITITNSGPSTARNTGIANAKGQWIMILDADDTLETNALESFANAIERWPDADMFVANFYDEDNGVLKLHLATMPEQKISNNFKSWFYRRILPCAGAFVCRRELMLKFPYKDYLKRLEDAEMLFNLFRNAYIVSTPYPTMRYRHQFSSESKKQPPIDLDFKGHLVFDNSKSIWEKICLYEFYIEAKNYYPEDAARLYPFLRRRYGLILAYHLAFWYRALFKK